MKRKPQKKHAKKQLSVHHGKAEPKAKKKVAAKKTAKRPTAKPKKKVAVNGSLPTAANSYRAPTAEDQLDLPHVDPTIVAAGMLSEHLDDRSPEMTKAEAEVVAARPLWDPGAMIPRPADPLPETTEDDDATDDLGSNVS